MLVLSTTQLFAQSPQKVSYQAVVRNSSNSLITNKQVGVRISILQSSVAGSAVYVETQTPVTDALGIMALQIGAGTVVSGNFTSIDWSSNTYFIKTDIDPNGGTSYTITGTSQLVTVPYALYADKSGSVTYASLNGKPSGLDENITDDMVLTGNQTVTGNKTFTGTTTVSAPINATDIANKAYVDALLDSLESYQAADLVQNGFTDPRDGNHYKVIKIGNQIWMAENLRYLPEVSAAATGSASVPYYYVYGYNGTNEAAAKATANYSTYGVLYNWAAVMAGASSSSTNPSGVQGICPPGWHIPSDEEWTQLSVYLGGSTIAGGKLKETGTSHWSGTNAGATNSSGFTALPGGYRDDTGAFKDYLVTGGWWSTTVEDDTANALSYIMYYHVASTYRYKFAKQWGFAVRCIKD